MLTSDPGISDPGGNNEAQRGSEMKQGQGQGTSDGSRGQETEHSKASICLEAVSNVSDVYTSVNSGGRGDTDPNQNFTFHVKRQFEGVKGFL